MSGSEGKYKIFKQYVSKIEKYDHNETIYNNLTTDGEI